MLPALDLSGTTTMTTAELSALVSEWFSRCMIYGDDGQFQVHGPIDQEGMDLGARLYTLVMSDRMRSTLAARVAEGDAGS